MKPSTLLTALSCILFVGTHLHVAAQPEVNGTYAVCPAGNNFTTTFSVPDAYSTSNDTVTATGTCVQPAGSNSWNGTFRMTNQNTGSYITGTCMGIYLNSPSADAYANGTDQDAYVLTSCYTAANGTQPIVTAQPYTLANGQTLPAGTASGSNPYLYYIALSNINNATLTGNSESLVYINDAGWYDATTGNYTIDPDPVNENLVIANCLGVMSPDSTDYFENCGGTTTCSITQCPAVS